MKRIVHIDKGNPIWENKIKTKEQLIFQDNFMEKIKQGIQTNTIRNSPVTLGTKKLSDNVSIDVYKVERVKAIVKDLVSFNANIKYYDFVKIDYDYATNFRLLGFETVEETYNYYKAYLKRDDVYLIHFRLI